MSTKAVTLLIDFEVNIPQHWSFHFNNKTVFLKGYWFITVKPSELVLTCFECSKFSMDSEF